MIRHVVLGLLFVTLAGCVIPRKAVIPVPVELLSTGTADGPGMLFLPGIRDVPADFATHEFASGVPADIRVVAADAHFGYYRNETIIKRIQADMLDGALADRSPVTIVGVSLGGLGALYYYCETRDPRIDRLVLLAPFLGEGDIIDDLQGAGSLEEWEPRPEVGEDFERKLWSCLKELDLHGANAPEVWLAFGTDDDFVPGHRLLANRLPAARVVTTDGGHNWQVWTRLWRRVQAGINPA